MSDIKMTEAEITQAYTFRKKHLAICREIGSPPGEERKLWDVLTWPIDVPYDSSPHPDTARADAAERLLAGVMAKVNTFSPSQNPAACLLRDVPGLRQWHVETGVRLEKIAQLTADLARLDAERERVARELAALTPASAASPAS